MFTTFICEDENVIWDHVISGVNKIFGCVPKCILEILVILEIISLFRRRRISTRLLRSLKPFRIRRFRYFDCLKYSSINFVVF